MDLYANVRPVVSAKGALGKAIDMLIIRENTECLYIKDETLVDEKLGKVAWARRKISQFASERIAKMAFNMARQRAQLRRYNIFMFTIKRKGWVLERWSFSYCCTQE